MLAGGQHAFQDCIRLLESDDRLCRALCGPAGPAIRPYAGLRPGGRQHAHGRLHLQEARYVRAQGLFLESAADARKINAEAVAVELDNSVAYVRAYWKRKSIWEEEMRKRRPRSSNGKRGCRRRGGTS